MPFHPQWPKAVPQRALHPRDLLLFIEDTPWNPWFMPYNSTAEWLEKFLLNLATEISPHANSLPREERDLFPACPTWNLFPMNFNANNSKTQQVSYFCSSSHHYQYKYHPESWGLNAFLKECSLWTRELNYPEITRNLAVGEDFTRKSQADVHNVFLCLRLVVGRVNRVPKLQMNRWRLFCANKDFWAELNCTAAEGVGSSPGHGASLLLGLSSPKGTCGLSYHNRQVSSCSLVTFLLAFLTPIQTPVSPWNCFQITINSSLASFSFFLFFSSIVRPYPLGCFITGDLQHRLCLESDLEPNYPSISFTSSLLLNAAIAAPERMSEIAHFEHITEREIEQNAILHHSSKWRG